MLVQRSKAYVTNAMKEEQEDKNKDVVINNAIH